MDQSDRLIRDPGVDLPLNRVAEDIGRVFHSRGSFELDRREDCHPCHVACDRQSGESCEYFQEEHPSSFRPSRRLLWDLFP